MVSSLNFFSKLASLTIRKFIVNFLFLDMVNSLHFFSKLASLTIRIFIVNFLFLDMVNSVKPDERSVMAYVSSYYHAFSGAQQVSIFIIDIWHLNMSEQFEIPVCIIVVGKKFVLFVIVLGWDSSKQNL